MGERPVYRDAYRYLKELIDVFHKGSDEYNEFIDMMRDYNAQRFDIESLKAKIKELFKEHRSLIVGLNAFLPKDHVVSLPPENDVDAGVRMPEYDDAIKFVAKFKSRFQEDGSVYKCFVQCLTLYVTKKIPQEVARRELAALVSNHPDLQLELAQLVPDLEKHEPCTPSYRFIPEDRPVCIASFRTEDEQLVLNDSLVAATSRKGRPFKHMRKNPYECSLLRCEDDRFELDMVLETVSSTITRVENIMKEIDKGSIPIPIDECDRNDYFSAYNIRCIERLYGDHYDEVKDVLWKKPSVALPVILTRLKQKQEEWRRCQTDFNATWVEVFAKNFHKSLDHRGFNFKVQDMKSLTPKALLAEIKESSQPLSDPTVIPQMEFEYPDPNIHDDIYQLIKYSCGQKYKAEQLDKVMSIWINFLEPMLGIPPRHDASEDAKDVLHAQNINSNINPSGNNIADVASEVVTNNALEDASCKRPLLSPSGPVPECIMIQGYQQASVQEPKTEREEGELSPEEDFDEHNFAACSRIQGYQQVSVQDSKSEREEGELSPEEDFDEYNFAACSNGVREAMCNSKDENSGRAVEDDALYEAEESAQGLSDNDNAHREGEESDYRLSDDSENRCDDDGNDSMDESEGAAEETNDVEIEYNGVLPLFYGNDSFYCLFRLHHMLYERLQTAKLCSSSSTATIDNDTESADRYARFGKALYNLLNGCFDQEKFEQKCCTILGAESYLLFTLDQWIFGILKQLHWIATREINSRFIELYYRESSRKLGRFKESGYNEKARRLLPDKNIFRLEYMPEAARLSIQLMKP